MCERQWQRHLLKGYEKELLAMKGVKRVMRSLGESWKQEWEDYLRVCRYQTNHPFFWDGLGKLGNFIRILYCGRLFASQEERKLYLSLYPTNGVTDKDLCHIASLALLGNLQVDEPLISILDKIMTSGYFLYEDPSRCSKSVRCLRRLYRKRKERFLLSLLRDLLYRYKVQGTILGWRPIDRPSNLFAPRIDTCVDDEHALSQLIHAINSCSFTSLLLTSKPPKSVIPHSHALMRCMEHAYLWMVNTRLSIYKDLQALSYSSLRSGAGEALLAAAQNIYSQEQIPAHEETVKRKPLIWFNLYGVQPVIPFHKLETYEYD